MNLLLAVTERDCVDSEVGGTERLRGFFEKLQPAVPDGLWASAQVVRERHG